MYWNDETEVLLVVYVDDILAAGEEGRARACLTELRKVIDFDTPTEIAKYLGCHHKFKRKGKVTKVTAEMRDYCVKACEDFATRSGHKFSFAPTPYAPEQSNEVREKLEAVKGEFAEDCAHHLMTLMYAARIARPTEIVAVTRLASFISRWSAECDRKLRRLFDFVHSHTDLVLSGQLSTEDRETAELVVWPDADLAGDKATSSRSTSGRFVELVGSDGRGLPLQWASHKQGATAMSTPDAESTSLSDCIKLDGLPLQSLFSLLLKRPITLRAKEDNTPCITAVGKGYSGALRYLPRTQRTSIGFLNEVFHASDSDPEGECVLEYACTKTQKGTSSRRKSTALMLSMMPSKGLALRVSVMLR